MGIHPKIIPFTALFLLLLSVPAHAFIFLTGAKYNNNKGERPVSEAPIWPTRTLSFVVNTNLSIMNGSLALPITGAELLESAQESVNAWAAACRADIRIRIVGTTSDTYNTSDGVNVIQWDNRTTAEGNYYSTSTSTLAAATSVLSGAEILDCDIVLNGNSTTSMKFSPAAGEADLRSVLTHEIGHCLGLDHPIEPPTYTSTDPFITASTMVQTAATGLDPSDSSRRDIAQDDRDGIECIYERGKPFRGGLHCGSYSGTNGQGALTGVVVGGPTAIDTVCGGDAQGRNVFPSLESGDGCVTSSIASTGEKSKRTLNPGGLQSIGGTSGFLLLIAGIFAYRLLRRRSLRPVLVLPLALFLPNSARAMEVELTYGVRKISPALWNSFAGMDPGAAAWDTSPNAVKMGSLSELRATAFSEYTPGGKWGGSFSFIVPKSMETRGKAQGAALQTKKTSISGLRIGPDFRWYPIGETGPVRWFIGGRFGIGIFYGNQTFTNTTESSVSYRAWSTELALSTGAEIPLGAIHFVVEGGYSRHRSSYFSSSGNSGPAYSDFPSGTRLATNTGSGTEDVRFDGSGIFATLGLQMSFGSQAPEPASTPIPQPHKDWEIDPIPGMHEEMKPQDNPTNQPDPVPF